jgi:hypothetical protein
MRIERGVHRAIVDKNGKRRGRRKEKSIAGRKRERTGCTVVLRSEKGAK